MVETDAAPLVIKAYAEDPSQVVAVIEALARAGLADGRAPSVPPLLAYDGTWRSP